jgi:hypothetical protein
MDIQFLPDDSENWLPGWSSNYLPQFFVTPDRKIMKKVDWRGRVTYHLPETYYVVAFSDLGAAFHAAYGYPLPEEAS